jgi:hypothetical protein
MRSLAMMAALEAIVACTPSGLRRYHRTLTAEERAEKAAIKARRKAERDRKRDQRRKRR